MYRLLIADDEIKIREVIAEYGRINNYSVMEASDGLQAIEMVEKHDFDCVILDIMMPNLDGYTACKRIKEIKNVQLQNNAVYNLAGQKVGNDYKGIVIVNGKKFMQK